MRSHTSATFTLGEGAISSMSRKQHMNTWSWTEAKVEVADEIVGPMILRKNFMEGQGYPLKENIPLQDDKSAMLLEKNCLGSCGKRSRHLNIQLFYIADQKEKANIHICCPTDLMIGDYMTKPLHDKKIMGFDGRL